MCEPLAKDLFSLSMGRIDFSLGGGGRVSRDFFTDRLFKAYTPGFQRGYDLVVKDENPPRLLLGPAAWRPAPCS